MPKRIVLWSPTARAELRAIDRETAWQILQAIDRYLETGAGDVIKLQPPRTEFRLRSGDYRLISEPLKKFGKAHLSLVSVSSPRHRAANGRWRDKRSSLLPRSRRRR